jgi:hypothetical protein
MLEKGSHGKSALITPCSGQADWYSNAPTYHSSSLTDRVRNQDSGICQHIDVLAHSAVLTTWRNNKNDESIPPPVVFLVYANDHIDPARHLRNLKQAIDGMREALRPAEEAGLCEVIVEPNASAEQIVRVFRSPKYRTPPPPSAGLGHGGSPTTMRAPRTGTWPGLQAIRFSACRRCRTWTCRRVRFSDCNGNARQSERVFGWGREMVQTGLGEIRAGIVCVGTKASFTGNKCWEEEHPEAADLCRLAEAHVQQNPSFRTPIAFPG